MSRDRTADVARHGLNYVMGFDHVIQVHEDGTVTDAPDAGYDTFEPEFTGAEGVAELHSHPLAATPWTNFGDGYTSQQGGGNVLHNCESIGAGLERDILATPGFYVAVYCTWEPDEDDLECPGHESLDGAHMGEAVYCDGTCAQAEPGDTVEGWTVAYKETLA